MDKDSILKRYQKALEYDRPTLEAFIGRLERGEISAFYYGPKDDWDFEFSLLVHRLPAYPGYDNLRFRREWSRPLSDAGGIVLTVANGVSIELCEESVMEMRENQLSRNSLPPNLFDVFKWREVVYKSPSSKG